MKRLSVFGVGLILCGAAQAQDPAVAREPTYSLATTSALLRFPGSPFDALRRYGGGRGAPPSEQPVAIRAAAHLRLICHRAAMRVAA